MSKIPQKERIDNSNTLNLFSDRRVLNDNTSLLRSLLHETVPVCDCCGKSKNTLPDYSKDYFTDLKAHRDTFCGKFSTVKGGDPVGLLGHNANYSATLSVKQLRKNKKDLTPAEKAEMKYAYKNENIERKNWIGKKAKRVGECGIKPIPTSDNTYVQCVQGEKGSMYLQGMQKCVAVWLCPICTYKLMKARAKELYSQLKAHKKARKTILFITFTLQHNITDRLADLHEILLGAWDYANKSNDWKKAKKAVPVEFLRVLEVLYGEHGWHEHLHVAFVGDPEIIKSINVFVDKYKQYLSAQGLLVNENTVVIEKWNGKLNRMNEYMFKGMLEKELTGGNISKSGHGKTFFELVDEQIKREKGRTKEQNADLQQKEHRIIDEYIKAMKNKRQYYPSRGFWDAEHKEKQKTDEEIVADDKAVKVLFRIPLGEYWSIMRKGIALNMVNEYQYGGKDRMIWFLSVNFCNTIVIDFPVDSA